MKKIDVIKSAKEHYLNHIAIRTFMGMCCAFKYAVMDMEIWLTYTQLVKNIPEFNPKFFNANEKSSYWWGLYDTESRIAAFDTLIKLYENNNEDFKL